MVKHYFGIPERRHFTINSTKKGTCPICRQPNLLYKWSSKGDHILTACEDCYLKRMNRSLRSCLSNPSIKTTFTTNSHLIEDLLKGTQ